MNHKQHERIARAEKQLPLPEATVWTTGACLALAQQSCTFCYGLGQRAGRNEQKRPCNCVFRAIFRACYDKFRAAADKAKHISRVSLESGSRSNKSRTRSWGMPAEEFCADFCLIAKRVLDEQQFRLFTFHFLLGADFKLCCRKLGMDRGTFFHETYRIEQKLGRAFAEIQPYSLFPTDAYFASTPGRTAKEIPAETELPVKPVMRFPLALKRGSDAPLAPVKAMAA